ncbi:hypothetical protein [Pollutimonas bauzanensis]|uniref:Uncharacterized protein n=1 Tax=Pollutimonas bauzanensis TaxID=658167 RepID=A0A1M5UIZ7_9BURK|nr:hypothetical protein [Pollutimonas bauzanensis]SHH62947.1 hypothetical protein SAMN04488135_10413 [Pollutimonas bauzanensis]
MTNIPSVERRPHKLRLDIRWLSSEHEVLRKIAGNRQSLSNTIHFALDAAFPYPEHAFGQDILVGININRERLGLPLDRQPGDIDYLIVPIRNGSMLADRSIAIEAKVLRPTISNPGRNVNKMGGTQVRGLIRDGFPFVGLLHISVPESLPVELHWGVKELTGRILADGALEEKREVRKIDLFPLLSARRQYGRVSAIGLPDEIGYSVIGFSLSLDGQQFIGNTIGDNRRPTRNPATSERLIESINSLVKTEPSMFSLVEWYPSNG